MKKHSFREKILYALLFFSVLLMAALCMTVSICYKHKEMQRYHDLAYSYTRTAADYIDGDRVLSYVENQETDAYYEQVMNFLNCTQRQTDILYYYVFVPYEDDLVYVWDADNIEGACTLGQHEKYMKGGKEASFRAMEGRTEERIEITDDETYGYIGSAYSPIYNSAGESVALVGVDLSMPDINANLRYFNMVIIISIVIVILIFISVLYFIFNRALIRPINRLNDAAKNMVSDLERENDLDIRITTGDEIQELAESFGQMYVEVKEYIRKLESITAEKERIGAELNVARTIQADMLPCIFPPFPERHDFDIYATMTPAKEVGGDFYDFFLVDEDHLAMVMADVSGKGVPAALFMMISKTLLKSATQAGLSPKAVLEQVNNQLCENNDAEMFVTVWLGILEISTGKLSCANAGHEYPAIRRKDGSFELYKDRHGFVLAGMEGTRYQEYELNLAPGDSLFVYTDGVAEATDAENQLYGTPRMLEALNRRADGSCQELLELLHADIDAFVGDAPQFDDITMLCLKMLPRNSLKVKPLPDTMQEVTAFVEQILKQAEVPGKEIMKLNIAVDEIYSNIMYYSGAAEAEIGCCVTERRAVLTFADNGKPYNPLEQELPDITLSAEERKIGGLGIFMLRKTMDEVSYEYVDGRNVLKVVKKW